jgi:hypothetical protein
VAGGELAVRIVPLASTCVAQAWDRDKQSVGARW